MSRRSSRVPSRLLPVRAVALLAAWLVAGPAQAIDPAPPALPEAGQVVTLKDRRAGFFEDVSKRSREVSWVRDGAERPMVPGLTLYLGDAVRTVEGTCSVLTPTGWLLEIDERSQVRLDAEPVQRLGRVAFSGEGPLVVRVGEATLRADGGSFVVQRDVPGVGELAVVEGAVTFELAGGTIEVAAGSALPFAPDGIGDLRPFGQDEVAAVARRRAERFEATVQAGSRRNRFLLRVEGGVTWFDQLRGWGRGGLEGRLRAYGPLWVVFGASVAGRGVDESSDAKRAFALPAHAGIRFLGDLPRSFFISGGADLLMVVGARCTDQENCARQTAVEPGGRLAAGVGLFLSKRFGFDVEFAGGLLRKLLPPPSAGQEATAVVDPFFDLSIGIFVRLWLPRPRPA